MQDTFGAEGGHLTAKAREDLNLATGLANVASEIEFDAVVVTGDDHPIQSRTFSSTF